MIVECYLLGEYTYVTDLNSSVIVKSQHTGEILLHSSVDHLACLSLSVQRSGVTIILIICRFLWSMYSSAEAFDMTHVLYVCVHSGALLTCTHTNTYTCGIMHVHPIIALKVLVFGQCFSV